MSGREVPEPWATRLVEKGFTDGRSQKVARPSMSNLADAIGVHTTTVAAAIFRERQTKADVIVDLVNALGPDVAEWLGVPYHGPWTPPAVSSLLTERQRKALEEIINVMTEREESAHGNAAPTAEAKLELGGKKPKRVRDVQGTNTKSREGHGGTEPPRS